MSGIAFFDFDGTLAKGDSLLPFLLRAVGLRRCLAGLLRAAITRVRTKGDFRTAFKEELLLSTLGGVSLERAARAAERMKIWPRWIEKTVFALKEHRLRGDHIVIATGSLDLYIESMLSELPHDAVLCTRMEIKDGFLTGRMLEGNCTRAQKARLAAAYLAEHGPFSPISAYGNAPHDLQMLALANERTII